MSLNNQEIESIKSGHFIIGLHKPIYLKLSKISVEKGQTLIKGRAFQKNSP